MKYRTVIELVSDADNSFEAADIAGEYLRGDLESGVSMRCSTKELRKYNSFNYITLAAFLVVIAILSFAVFSDRGKNHILASADSYPSSVSAIQPPLQTNITDEYFTKEWEAKKGKAVIEYIKR